MQTATTNTATWTTMGTPRCTELGRSFGTVQVRISCEITRGDGESDDTDYADVEILAAYDVERGVCDFRWAVVKSVDYATDVESATAWASANAEKLLREAA